MAAIICTVINDLKYDQRMHRICASLRADGHDVTLVGRKTKAGEPSMQFSFNQKRITCWFSKGKIFYIEYNIRLLFWLLWRRVDVINSVDLDTLLPGYLVARLRGKKLVYDAHEYFSEVPEVVDRPKIMRVWEWLADILIPRTDLAYTVSVSLAEAMEKRYGKPFGVVRNSPVRPTGAITAGRVDPPVILYQGALNMGRGLEVLLHAMQQVEGAQLWIAGEGDLSNTLRKMTRSLEVEDKVTFLGQVPPQELNILTLQATIGYNLLENKGLSYYYSLANKALDYIQAGLPSLQPDFPEYRRIQQRYHCFKLVEYLNASHLAKTINQLLTDQAELQRLRTNCLLAAADLNWEHEEISLIRYYREMLST